MNSGGAAMQNSPNSRWDNAEDLYALLPTPPVPAVESPMQNHHPTDASN